MAQLSPSALPVRRRRHPRWVAALFVFWMALPAHAWGPLGHRLVARLAEDGLTVQARAEVDRLLRGETDPSLAGIASWADELRGSDPDLGRRSAPWHYVNLGESGCRYEAARDCRDGACIVAALDEQARILADHTRSDAARQQALKFVVHLAGDAHQPMHAGYAHDRGGNRYQVNFNGKGTNLHSLWDSGMLASRGLGEEAWLARLRALPAPAAIAVAVDAGSGARPWIEQSCRLAVAPGVYPAGHVIDAAYVDAHLATEERQLRLAGARLAALLNASLSGRH